MEKNGSLITLSASFRSTKVPIGIWMSGTDDTFAVDDRGTVEVLTTSGTSTKAERQAWVLKVSMPASPLKQQGKRFADPTVPVYHPFNGEQLSEGL